MTALLATVCGMLVSGGMVLLVAGVHSPPTGAPPSSTRVWKSLVDGRGGRAVRRRWWQVLAAVLAGLVAGAVTGWPLLVVLVPVVAFGIPVVLSAPPNRDLALLEALDRWVRTLGSLLPTGRSITDAIRLSQRQAPERLAGPLRLLVARLDDRWTSGEALRAMADELDSADADAVLAALALAAERGGTGAAATLHALADTIQDRLRAQREIETERAKPRIVVRQVTIISVAVLALALVFGRAFFEPYATPTGQVILACLLAAYVLSLIVLRRMTMPRRRERILRSLR